MSYAAIANVLTIIEENNYYPFGLKHSGYNNTVALGGNDEARKRLYNGKEFQSELGLNDYDYGARNYDPAIGRWMSMDEKSEKYYNISPYTYVADNPMTNIDPDGKKIIFIVGNENPEKVRNFEYRKGNFYDVQTKKRYNPGSKEVISPTMYKVLTAYRKIEKSNDKILRDILHTLEKSEQKHWVAAGSRNYVDADPDGVFISETDKKVKSGIPVDTQTFYNFSKEDKEEFEQMEGVKDSDFSTVVHEMSHQFDYDQGQNGDSVGVPSSSESPTEQRAVERENRARYMKGLRNRTTYGGVAIKWTIK